MQILINTAEAKSIINNAFVNKADTLYYHMSDKVYRLPTLKQITEILSSFVVNKYIEEIADCDNRTLLLASKFVEQGLAIGMIDVNQLVYGVNDPQYRHQICMTILADTKKVVVIEPETKQVYTPNDLLRLTFVDFRT